MAKSAGKEDPVELDSNLTWHNDARGVDIGGRFVDCEIPLLLTLFCSFDKVEAGSDSFFSRINLISSIVLFLF